MWKKYKHFIGYLYDDHKVKPLHIVIPKTSAYVKLVSNDTCLVLISLDSALKKDENYFLQVSLKECKYNEKKLARH